MNTLATQHKGFNAVANGPHGYLGKGNVISDNQFSFHLRAWNDCACNGHEFAPGQLQTFDLGPLSEGYPEAYRVLVRYLATGAFKDQSGWVYLIRHYEGKRAILHGMIVTTANHKRVRLFQRQEISRSLRNEKSNDVLEVVSQLLAA